MAKKGQAIQLQTEVNTNEEWDELIKRSGLICTFVVIVYGSDNLLNFTVVDVYSDWCGPCSGMAANLKKIKLEIGGDTLQLATAKADNITVLERFRNKSEPTWMFIAKGKMVNLVFGANAPKLARVIEEELKKEAEALEGSRERIEMEFTELSKEEKIRWEAAESIAQTNRKIEQEARIKALHKKRVDACENILQTQSNMGVLVVFPHAKDKYVEILEDAFTEANLMFGVHEKIKIDKEQLQELLYFTKWTFSAASKNQLCHTEDCRAVIVKPSGDTLSESIESVILPIIYGPSKKPPGSPESPAQVLTIIVDENEKEEENKVMGISKTSVDMPTKEIEKKVKEGRGGEDDDGDEDEEDKKEDAEEVESGPVEYIGLWTPQDAMTKANCIKIFFPKIAEPLAIPEPEPIPPYIAIAFDAFKKSEVLELVEEYPSEVLRYGFFTDDNIETTKLIAKTPHGFDKKRLESTTATEKIILQLAKRKSECVLAFAQLGPSYMSINAVEGERDCEILFPKDYDEPEEEEEIDIKKKTKRKSKSKSVVSEMRESTGSAPEPTETQLYLEGSLKAIDEGEEIIVAEGYDEQPLTEGENAAQASEDSEQIVETNELLIKTEISATEMPITPDEIDKATSPIETSSPIEIKTSTAINE